MLGVLQEVRELADRLDLGQIDERLDRLALAEVEAERGPVGSAVFVGKPEPEQPSGGVRGVRVVLGAPRVDACADSVDDIRAFAGLAALWDRERIAGGWQLELGHLMRTSASLVVSLPKMSMIFTTIE